jgi:hypothetical protein
MKDLKAAIPVPGPTIINGTFGGGRVIVPFVNQIGMVS